MNPAALGRYLRESREAKEITLEDAVVALRIRRNVLEAFERGEFDLGDSPVRLRGMLRNYARYLGLEEERVLQYYEAAHDKKRKGRFFQRETHVEPLAPRKITDTPPSLPAVKIPTQSRIGGYLRNLAMVLVSIAAIAVIGLVMSNMLEVEEIPQEATATLGTVTITPTYTASFTPRAIEASATPDRVALGLMSIQVVVEMQQRSWLRVRVDGQDAFTGILEPNVSQTYEGSTMIEILAANAAALNITYNGVEQQQFGERGQQVELKFSPSGVESSLVTTTIAPTEITPEATQQVALPTATIEGVQILVTPTALIAGLPSPTPLFSVAGDASPVPASVEASSVQASGNNPTTVVVPTATNPAPTLTATIGAVLPLRATPADATPTKQG